MCLPCVVAAEMAVAGPCWACHAALDGAETSPPRLERGSMREQASSRSTRSCRCSCLNRSQRAGSLCRSDARRAGRGPRPGAQPSVAGTAPFARHNAVHTQVCSASPRPRQPVEADGGGRLMGPLTSLSHASSCPCKDWSECPPASPLAYLLTCSLTLRWGSANQATTCGQAAQTSATMPHRRLYHRRRRRRRDRLCSRL
jgi:hypothetical protein